MTLDTADASEVVVIVVSMVALTANAIGLLWSIDDWRTMRSSRRSGDATPLACIRALRRVAFMLQATLAQLVLLSGMVGCALQFDGPPQALLKNWTFLILAIQLGLKAIIDLCFVYVINRYPYEGTERRSPTTRGVRVHDGDLAE